jgi:ABC-type branched-subunit amino acid transport system ATPase component
LSRSETRDQGIRSDGGDPPLEALAIERRARQNALMALSIADYAYVLESGKIVLVGNGADSVDDEKVQHAYLG